MAKPTREKRAERQNYASAKDRATKRGTGGDRTSIKITEGKKYFKLDKSGVKRIRIIPYKVGKGNPYADEGSLHYERTYFVHRGIGPNQDSYVCLKKTCGKPCPVCDHRAKMEQNPKSDEDEIKQLFPKERQLFNVIDLSNEEDGVQLWDNSFHLFGKLLDAEINNADPDENFANFFHLEDGMDLKLGVAQQTGGGYKYMEVETIGFKARTEALDPDLLDEAMPLDELLKVVPYDKLKAIFLQKEEGADDDDDDDDDDEEAPPKKKKKAPPVDDDDDDDEEELPPKKKKKAPIEDDDDDDDEEEEEPAPKKKGTKKAKWEDDDDK